jgi:WD repeat-containing protein 61
VGRYESYANASEGGEPCELPWVPIYSNVYIIHLIAWSVSLNPKGGIYASTGGSGNVTIHSAELDNFGERHATLTSGRNKFGMQCKHVRIHLPFPSLSSARSCLTSKLLTKFLFQSPDGSRVALATESGQVFVFDVESTSLISTYTSHAMAVRSLAWSLDSQVLFPRHHDLF